MKNLNKIINKINIKNKKAFFNYEIIDKYNCGICLFGTEVKSIRNGGANFNDSYCLFINNELYIRNLNISEYKFANIYNHETKRDRKLLLTKKEIKKIEDKVKIKGNTIIPLRLYINDNGLIKIEIGLCKGKHTYDKRESIKAKDINRLEDRLFKIK